MTVAVTYIVKDHNSGDFVPLFMTTEHTFFITKIIPTGACWSSQLEEITKEQAKTYLFP